MVRTYLASIGRVACALMARRTWFGDDIDALMRITPQNLKVGSALRRYGAGAL
jgi:hypothetical protein